MAFTIPGSLNAVYNEFADSLLSSDMTSFVCKAHYPPLKEACINCEPGPFGNGSTYKVGGPNQFSFGVCPICQGAGFKEVNTSENLRLRVYISAKKFKEPENIETAIGYVIGFLTDLDKIKRSAYLEIISEHSNYHMLRFRLAGQPLPHGFGRTRYFRCDIENN